MELCQGHENVPDVAHEVHDLDRRSCQTVFEEHPHVNQVVGLFVTGNRAWAGQQGDPAIDGLQDRGQGVLGSGHRVDDLILMKVLAQACGKALGLDDQLGDEPPPLDRVLDPVQDESRGPL